jgi:hypothetical protein
MRIWNHLCKIKLDSLRDNQALDKDRVQRTKKSNLKINTTKCSSKIIKILIFNSFKNITILWIYSHNRDRKQAFINLVKVKLFLNIQVNNHTNYQLSKEMQAMLNCDNPRTWGSKVERLILGEGLVWDKTVKILWKIEL